MARGDLDFRHRYGPWALVTGAAQGMGEELARQCALRGLDLILVDRQAELVGEVARTLERDHGVSARAVTLDLTRSDVLDELISVTEGVEVGLLVSNAALSTIDRFLDIPRATLTAELEVNARAPLLLAHHYGAAMAERRRGGMIFLSSLSAVTSAGYVTHYVATKAYNRALAEGLWYELAPRGVDVLAVLPGMIATPAWYASDPSDETPIKVMSCEQVAIDALNALGRTPSVVPGAANRLAAFFMGRLLPRSTAIRLVSRSMEKIFGAKLFSSAWSA
jgi:hypothetical protein